MEDKSAKSPAEFFCKMYGEFYQGLKKEGLSKMWAAIMAFMFVYTIIIAPSQNKNQRVDVLSEILKKSPVTKSH